MASRRFWTTASLVVAVELLPAVPSTHVTIQQRSPARGSSDPADVDVSANGRYVAFESYARLVETDTNSRSDIYVFDRQHGVVTLETHSAERLDRRHPRLSGDGRFLVYQSAVLEGGLVQSEVILKDRWMSDERVLTLTPDGRRSNGWSRTPDISDDGRVVVFSSSATNLTGGEDLNAEGEDVYFIECPTGAIQRISLDGSGAHLPVGSSFSPSVDADGSRIAFVSTAPLRSGHAAGSDPSRLRAGSAQVFVRDMRAGTTRPVTGPVAGQQAEETSSAPAISADGRYVAFVSSSERMTAKDRNRLSDVFFHDLQSGTTTLLSKAVDGLSANGRSGGPAVSADGRFVVFHSDASNLVCSRRCPAALEDINLLWDVFLLDRQTQRISRLSADTRGGWMEPSIGAAIDGSGQVVAFSSRHPTDTADRENDFDLFVTVSGSR